MQREVVSTGHRYVQALMNALVLGVKDPIEAERLLNAGLDRVDKITAKDRVRLLELVPKTVKQLGFAAPVLPEESPHQVLTPTDQAGFTAPTQPEEAPSNEGILFEDLFTEAPLPTDEVQLFSEFLEDTSSDGGPSTLDPVRQAISEVMDRAVASLRAPQYKERFYVSPLEHEGKKYIIVVSGTLRNSHEYNIYGTSGDAPNFGSLDDRYFYCQGDRRVSVQRELDDVGPFSHIVLWGWALVCEKGRDVRLWINKRGSKDRARARITLNPELAKGYDVIRKHFEK